MVWLRSILVFVLACAVVAPALADDTQRASQIAAAKAAARERLAGDVADEPLANGVSVVDFFNAMRARHRFRELVFAAEPVGGARWIDDSTCQVRVELSGDLVAEMILTLALAEPNRTPVPYSALEEKLRPWQRRSFSATASAITWDRAIQVEPSKRWKAVPAEARRAALEEARMSAARRAVELLLATDPAVEDSTESNGGVEDRLAHIAADETRQDELVRFAGSQPVTAISYRNDETVQIALALPADDWIAAIRAAGGEDRAFDREAEKALRRRISLQSAVVSGRGRATTTAETSKSNTASAEPPRGTSNFAPSTGGDVQTPGREDIVIPSRPPAWARSPIFADATSPRVGSDLKTARAAEATAMAALRDRLAELPWQESTLGDAMSADRDIAAAVDRAMASAKVANIEYLADGGVQIRLSLDGRRVWSEVSRAGR